MDNSVRGGLTANSVRNTVKLKVKVIPQQAEVAQGVPGRLRPRIFFDVRHYKGGKVVSHRHRPPLPQEKSLVLTFRG